MKTPVEVQQHREYLCGQIVNLQLEIDKLGLDLARLQIDCPHENVVERWGECFDCGKENL